MKIFNYFAKEQAKLPAIEEMENITLPDSI